MIDHEYTSVIVCPYCGFKYEDSWDFDDSGEHECDECCREFSFSRIVTVDYVTREIKDTPDAE